MDFLCANKFVLDNKKGIFSLADTYFKLNRTNETVNDIEQSFLDKSKVCSVSTELESKRRIDSLIKSKMLENKKLGTIPNFVHEIKPKNLTPFYQKEFSIPFAKLEET